MFYELTKDRLATQLDLIDAADNKLGMLVSLGSALMGILVAVFAVRGSAHFGVAEYTVISIAGLLYLVVAGLSAYAYFARAWDIGPDLQQVWRNLWRPEYDDAALKWRIAGDFWDYYLNNAGAQKLKAACLPWVLVAVIAQTLTLVSALGLVAAGG